MEEKKAKKKHLGRGLNALLGPMNFDEDTQENLDKKPISEKFPKDPALSNGHSHLNPEQIRPNPYQPRSVWDDEELNDLADSIRSNGIIQPIIVRPSNGDLFEIIAGERRFRASQIAGLDKIPVIIRNVTDEQMLELALVENIHRSDLNPIERALAYKNYLNSFSLNQSEAAQKLGEDRSVISNHLRLLDLPKDIQDMLSSKQLSMGHARAVLSLPNDDLRRKIVNRAMAGRLSVREVERLVRKHLEFDSQTQKQKKEKAAYILDLEKQLQSVLGTKVKIESNKKGNKGRIIIDYYSLEEFEKITERIGLDNSNDI